MTHKFGCNHGEDQTQPCVCEFINLRDLKKSIHILEEQIKTVLNANNSNVNTSLGLMNKIDELSEAIQLLGALAKFYNEAWNEGVLIWDASNIDVEQYQLRLATLDLKIQTNPHSRAVSE